MQRATIILVPALLITLGGMVGGCEKGADTIGSPAGGILLDKHPCQAIAVTYSDPATIDTSWSGGIKDFGFVRAKGIYHLLHITDPATSWTTRHGERAFGHATSVDLVNWNTHRRINLLTDAAGWSPSFTWAPHVIYNRADGLYYMFYTGVKWADGAPLSYAEQRVGLARSSDLFTWERYDEDGEDGLILDGPDHEELPWSAYGTDGVDLPWEYDCRDPFVFDRGEDHGSMRYLMLNSVRLAPDAQLMAIAYAISGDLVHWHWLYYFPVTAGEMSESPNLLEHNGVFYLFWTDRYDGPAVRVACSTSGIFGDYELINAGDRLFGSANETLAEVGRTLYLAFDNAFVLHIKRDLLLPEVPAPEARVRVTDFTQCDSEYLFRGLEP